MGGYSIPDSMSKDRQAVEVGRKICVCMRVCVYVCVCVFM